MRDEISVHGCYPRDHGLYTHEKREISKEEAAQILQIPMPPGDLFINKGFVLIESGTKGVPELRQDLVEFHSKRRNSGFPVSPGARAVYLHDGRYCLIRFPD